MQDDNPAPDNSEDMQSEYNFDYTKSRPNRFAEQLSCKRVIVVLDRDVSEVFTTPESVNEALRKIISHKQF